MAFVSDCSCECSKPELDVFSAPLTQTSIEASSYSEYHPLTSLKDANCLEFEANGSGEDYLDLNNSYLYVRAKVVQENGNNLEAEDAVAPVNNLLHSMFSQVDVSLNGTQISSSTNTYPYRAMIESQLSYGSEAKKTQLAGAMFFKDDAGKMDAIAVNADANNGFMARRAKAAGSREFEMMGRIHQDIFFQDRYIPNNVKLNLKLIRSRDAFCLMGGAQRKLKITAAKLLVRKVKLSDSVALAHAKALEEATAKFPIKRVVCKPFVIPQGLRDVVQEKLFSGQTPTRLVIGLVENEAFNGSRQKNPFNFQHFNLSEICMYLDGQLPADHPL